VSAIVDFFNTKRLPRFTALGQRRSLSVNQKPTAFASLSWYATPSKVFASDVMAERSSNMKRLALISLVTVLLASLSAFAQYGNQGSTGQQTSTTEQPSTKAVTVSGKIGDDGKSFVSDKDNKTWTVSNPEALKGHEGQEVKIKAHEDAAKNEVHVISVKKVKGVKTGTMKKDEMQK
jgi:hypothetical protein